MGMYDTIWCHVPLPDGSDGGGFQTKDLENALLTYRITEDGRLELEHSDMVPVGPPSPHPVFGMASGWQNYRRENVRWEDTDHHGDILFYKWTREDGMREYKARFTNGSLQEIKVIEEKKGD